MRLLGKIVTLNRYAINTPHAGTLGLILLDAGGYLIFAGTEILDDGTRLVLNGRCTCVNDDGYARSISTTNLST